MSSDDLNGNRTKIMWKCPCPCPQITTLKNHGCRTIIWTVQHNLQRPLSATSTQPTTRYRYVRARPWVYCYVPARAHTSRSSKHSYATCERLHPMLHRMSIQRCISATFIPSNSRHRSSSINALSIYNPLYTHIVLFKNTTKNPQTTSGPLPSSQTERR